MDVKGGSVNGVYHETRLVSDIPLVVNLNLLLQFANEFVEFHFTLKHEIPSCAEGGEVFIRLFGIVVVEPNSEIGLNPMMISHLFHEMFAQAWIDLFDKVRYVVSWGSRKEVDLLKCLGEGRPSFLLNEVAFCV